jgi:Metal binding domain of Ada
MTEMDDQPAASSGKTYTLLGADRRLYGSSTPGTLGGHKGSRIYGRLDCIAALRAIAKGGYVKSRVFFADEEAAIAAGYRPCAICLSEKYRAGKGATVAVAQVTSPRLFNAFVNRHP